MNKPPSGFIIVVAGQVACAAVLAVNMVSRLPDNHTGWEPRWLNLVWIVGLGYVLTRKQWGAFAWLWAFASCLAVAVVLIATDQFNVLIQYDRWVRRGMPDGPLR